MRKIILAVTLLTLTLPLGACFETIKAVQGFAITQGMIDGARNSYDGTALAALASFSRLPTCPKGTAFSINNRCHDKALLKRMRNADQNVADAFNATQDEISAGNDSGAVAAWNTLQTAVAAIKKIIADNNLTVIL